ncbi:uncharacterized protein ARMOST_06522 [Armillaria ostoyae]|uniref:Uncharacterized protein n=1 Tax=Armillaria ostoyae TaxID=47428 RepID=A0A284R383_ARMOS|nr:uncharacterized protein ARMOST_06522 [Armillaria ostoyae]
MARAKRSHHGGRSIAKREQKFQRWILKGGPAKAAETARLHTVFTTTDRVPSEFLKIRQNQATVRKIILQKYPEDPKTLPILEIDNKNFQMNSCDQLKELEATPGLPVVPIIFKLFNEFIPRSVQRGIITRFDALMATKPRYLLRSRNPHSSKRALHVGSWECSMRRPSITAEAQHQKTTTITRLDNLLQYMKRHIFQKIVRAWCRDCPQLVCRSIRAHHRLQRCLKKAYKKRPTLDFGPAFFSIAMKDGSSEHVHLDFSDDIHTMTWIIPIGDWEGGEFCIPQLGIGIPLKPGQVLAIRTWLLAHCNAPITAGRRVVFTCFSEKTVLKHADLHILEKDGYIVFN